MKRTAYYNGKVYTADKENPQVEAFVVEDSKFVFVGKNEDLPECDEKIDLCGKCVIPGIIDSHCHMLSGINKIAMNMLVIPKETKPSELGKTLLDMLSETDLPDEQAVVAVGIDLTVGEFCAKDIDKFIPDRVVMVFSFDGHAALINTKAMKELGLDRDSEDPEEDSYYVRDKKGDPTGLIIEISAMRPCMQLMSEPTDEVCREALSYLVKEYSSLGYTTVFDAMTTDGEDDKVLRILKSLDDEEGLPLRVFASFGYNGEDFLESEKVMEIMKKNRSCYTSGNIACDTLKIITDGTVEEHSALLYEPYADSETKYGYEKISFKDMKKAADLAAKEGFSIHIHAIGDRAVTAALDTLCSVGKIKGTKTIAHNQLYRDADIEKIKNAGDIFFQTTPQWMKNDAYTLKFLGKKRFNEQFRIGTMQKNGVIVTFGSDSCLDPETSNAFEGMFYACARGNEQVCKEECLPPESEKLTRMESLFAYTINGAKQLGVSGETGSIAVGKSADFVIADRNIIDCDLKMLKETKVLKTFFRGREV